LEIGETLVATYTFTTSATVGTNLGSAFKIALMDFNNPGLAADLTSSSISPQPLYTNLPGYRIDFDLNTDATADTALREHLENTTGRFLGTTTEWNLIGDGPGDGYTFAANTEYVGVLSVTRTGPDSMDIFGSLLLGATLLTSHTETDTSNIANHFGMLGFWANSNTFGSSNTVGNPDNGITFSNIKVEVVTPAPASPPTLDITLAGSKVVLHWPTSGTTGFALEGTSTMSAPSWSPAGSPTVIGDTNYVTNSLTGDAKFYRLRKL
jgi:hypothetical protein